MAIVATGKPLREVDRIGRHYVVVSGDSHAGPSLEHQLRGYCPPKYLAQFDEFVKAFRSSGFPRFPEMYLTRFEEDTPHPSGKRVPGDVDDEPELRELTVKAMNESFETMVRIRDLKGSNDASARLTDMDEDGITSELIFAGAQNPEILPWAGGFDAGSSADDAELRLVGARIWNGWLADFCSAAPERLLGVAQVPFWDVEKAVKEVVWAKEHGLRAINFPAPRPDYPPYFSEVYEPFWSAIEEVDLPLVTHSASGEKGNNRESAAAMMLFLSENLWLSRRGLGQMIYGSVFDRHPNLQVGFVEQRANWIAEHLNTLDSPYYGVPRDPRRYEYWYPEGEINGPKKAPSEYWRSNCFLAASFMAPFETEKRYEIGIHTMMWGTDYPHIEGTWPRTRLAMRNAFAGVPEDEVRAILGDNGARIFHLDNAELQAVADRIGPTPDELAVPLSREELPAYRGLAFREYGSWH